ncbi:MAG: hypothetical protein KDB65_10020 [Calditrichaeota bacterium]|nr:hypothetical protein [Calditrichota bacterium]MCB9369529.1 hypothetical protein [Calditrichota bacterium]
MFSFLRKKSQNLPARISTMRTTNQQPVVIPSERPDPPRNVTGNLFSATLDGNEFVWTGTNRSEFYRYLRDHVPIISSAVWAWVHLCATPQSYALSGSETEKRSAEKILDALDKRMLENPLVRRSGLAHLTEQFFLELFTTGRFCGEIIPLPDGKGIDYFHTIDADLVQWERDGRWKAFLEDDKGKKLYLNPQRFFFASLGADVSNPRGIEPLASIPFVAQIQEAMLSDMARSARMAGTPRLQIKVKPPKAFQHETDKEYQNRANRYFDDTVSQFRQLDPDDNIFTWDDVEITMIGGDSNRNFTWRLNREQVIEDVVTGLRLYPWVVGRSHGTTKNWVEAQFNLLMQIVDSVQNLGASLGNFLRNTELAMQGNLCKSEHIFEPNQDPFQLTRMQARNIEFDTVDKKVKRGYISKDDGARELGYAKAFDNA